MSGRGMTASPKHQPEGAGYVTRDAAKSGLTATLMELGEWSEGCFLEPAGEIGIAESPKPTHTAWKFWFKRGKKREALWFFTAYGESWRKEP
jgi:hypothetical protein